MYFVSSLINERSFRRTKREIFAVLERGVRKYRVRILLRPAALRGEQLPCEELLRDQQQVENIDNILYSTVQIIVSKVA